MGNQQKQQTAKSDLQLLHILELSDAKNKMIFTVFKEIRNWKYNQRLSNIKIWSSRFLKGLNRTSRREKYENGNYAQGKQYIRDSWRKH